MTTQLVGYLLIPLALLSFMAGSSWLRVVRYPTGSNRDIAAEFLGGLPLSSRRSPDSAAFPNESIGALWTKTG